MRRGLPTTQEEVTEESKGTLLDRIKGKVTEEKPVDERVEEKRTEAEPPKEVAAAEPAEPKEEVTEESKGTVLGKLKGKITEEKPVEERVEEERTEAEPPKEVTRSSCPARTTSSIRSWLSDSSSS